MSKLRINDLESLDTGASVGVDVLAGVPAELDRRVIYVDTIADLQALPVSSLTANQSADITTTGRAGLFVWKTGDRSSDVSGDPQQGIWIAPGEDATGASGAWMRQYNRFGQGSSVLWFGAVGDGVTDDTVAIRAAINYNKNGAVYFPGESGADASGGSASYIYRITSTIEVGDDSPDSWFCNLRGNGLGTMIYVDIASGIGIHFRRTMNNNIWPGYTASLENMVIVGPGAVDSSGTYTGLGEGVAPTDSCILVKGGKAIFFGDAANEDAALSIESVDFWGADTALQLALVHYGRISDIGGEQLNHFVQGKACHNIFGDNWKARRVFDDVYLFDNVDQFKVSGINAQSNDLSVSGGTVLTITNSCRGFEIDGFYVEGNTGRIINIYGAGASSPAQIMIKSLVCVSAESTNVIDIVRGRVTFENSAFRSNDITLTSDSKVLFIGSPFGIGDAHDAGSITVDSTSGYSVFPIGAEKTEIIDRTTTVNEKQVSFDGAGEDLDISANPGFGEFLVGRRVGATDYRSSKYLVQILDDGTTVDQSEMGFVGTSGVTATFSVSSGSLHISGPGGVATIQGTFTSRS